MNCLTNKWGTGSQRFGEKLSIVFSAFHLFLFSWATVVYCWGQHPLSVLFLKLTLNWSRPPWKCRTNATLQKRKISLQRHFNLNRRSEMSSYGAFQDVPVWDCHRSCHGHLETLKASWQYIHLTYRFIFSKDRSMAFAKF